MRRSAAQVIARLTGEGMTFRAATVRLVGRYGVPDADWNYKDVPHLHVVHGGITRAVIADVTEDHIATVNFVRVPGLRLPITLYNYSVDRTTQVYFTTFAAWVLVVETTLVDVGGGRTEVTTTFNVGGSRPAMLLFPAIRWVLLRNNRLLMEGDIPMRERRGELRQRGYSFLGDDTGHGFESTMPLWPTHVVPPTTEPARFVVDDVVARTRGAPLMVGDDGHLGLRVEQVDGSLLVFPRTCMHEGACLDGVERRAAQLRCPWHDKRIGPLASFAVDSPDRQEQTTDFHRIALEGGSLVVTVPAS